MDHSEMLASSIQKSSVNKQQQDWVRETDSIENVDI